MDFKLLVLYSLVLLTNMVVNANFYFLSRKKEEYLWSLNFWTCCFFNFLFQGILSNHETFLGLSVMFFAGSYFFALKIFSKLAFIKFDSKKYSNIFLIFFLIGTVLSFFLPFQVFTLFLIMPAVVSFIHFSYVNWSKIKKQAWFYKISFIFYSLSLIHALDYPFLRLNPEFSEIGFLIAFVFSIFFSMTIHFLSDSIYINEIENKLNEKNEQSKKLFQQGIVSELLLFFSHEVNNDLQSIEMASSLTKIKANSLGINSFNEYSKIIDESLGKISRTLSLVSDIKNFSVESLDSLIKESATFVKNKNLNVSKIDSFLNIKTSKSQFIQFVVNILSKTKDNEIVNIYQINQNKIVFETISYFNDEDFYFSKLLSSQLNLVFSVKQNRIEIDISTIVVTDVLAS